MRPCIDVERASIARAIALVAWCFVFITSTSMPSIGQHSVARQWNDMLLEAIRNDYARPTVHARNLFHSAIAMYDIWASFDDKAETFLLGKSVGSYRCDFNGFPATGDTAPAVNEAINYASYRLLRHRFSRSPGAEKMFQLFDSLMAEQGLPTSNTSTDYSTGSAAALGNHMAECLIGLGRVDHANEDQDYANTFYLPANSPLFPDLPGNPDIEDLNHWQPLRLQSFVDQSGNVFGGVTPSFLSPEWGRVLPFALSSDDLKIYSRDGDYWVYHDPGSPPHLNMQGTGTSADYQWAFALVSAWSSHMSPDDGVVWDISPASIGNLAGFPTSSEELRNFYNLSEGGDTSRGWPANPSTGQPYEPQFVPRGDYARVLAEFWADGPDSETPPGHWFTILNYVNDHPLAIRRFRGEGPDLDPLEWDVKSYLALGGAVHDAAVAAWGIKGWYDYIRPISAIRAMAQFGQSTDPDRRSYSPAGLPLIDGLIEIIEPDDPLAGRTGRNIGKIKVRAWRGPVFIADPATDVSGVGWILAETWWPYQRPTFVTPPFAGYVSGHSTFSRAAAEVLTLLTGDPFFPGGIGEFHAPAREFLVFEDGPSVDVTLQWATYRDAADQCSLSRIWGGIHPPPDDIPGRIIGERIGVDAFRLAEMYFSGEVPLARSESAPIEPVVYPNPVIAGGRLHIDFNRFVVSGVVTVANALGQTVATFRVLNTSEYDVDLRELASGVYFVHVADGKASGSRAVIVLR